MMIERRGFILGAASLLAAPAVVRAEALMPVLSQHLYFSWFGVGLARVPTWRIRPPVGLERRLAALSTAEDAWPTVSTAHFQVLPRTPRNARLCQTGKGRGDGPPWCGAGRDVRLVRVNPELLASAR